MASRILGSLLAGTALLACPCHLPLTLPLLLAVLGGGSLGTVLTANTGLIVAAGGLYFVGALVAGFVLLSRHREQTRLPRDGCGCPLTAPADDGVRPASPAAPEVPHG